MPACPATASWTPPPSPDPFPGHSALRRAVAAALVGMLCGGAVQAQGPTRSLRLPPLARPPLTEELGAVEVASLRPDAVYGVVTGAPSRAINFPLEQGHPVLTVSGIARQDRSMCLEIHRADGAYRARAELALPAVVAGRVEIPLDSSAEVRQLMQRAPPLAGEMAVRARSAASHACASASPWLPVTWAGSGPADAALYLAVGGAALGMPSVRVDGGDPRRCDAVAQLVNRPDLHGMMFSSLCPIQAAPAGCNNARPARRVKVLWLQGDRVTAEADLRIAAACP